jgi:dihydrofolate synthase/folylpolyglutamate synthase
LTAAAFCFFAEQQVNVVVAEAGLGGRLDATNVGASQMCVVTPISFDHTQILGSTLKHIAEEKAAVIKSSTEAVFSAPQREDVRSVIERSAKKYGLKVFTVGKDIRYRIHSSGLSGETFSLNGLEHSWPKVKSPLLGEHQVVNASLAAGVVEYFLKTKGISPRRAVVRGIAQGRWPGRFEIVRTKPFVVIDGAHNEDSAEKLVEAVRKVFPKKKVFVLFGASKDKNISAILKQLQKISRDIIFTKAKHPRSFDFSKEKMNQGHSKNFLIMQDSKQAFAIACQKSKSKDVILAAGSIFLAAEIRKLCTFKV